MHDLHTRVLQLLTQNLRWLGLFGVFLCVSTWALDLAGWVHPCVYCRTQRSAIGLAGLVMMFPNPRLWICRYAVVVICFFGANISVAQLFLIVKSINAGESFGALNLFMASGALLTLTGQALLLFVPEEKPEP